MGAKGHGMLQATRVYKNHLETKKPMASNRTQERDIDDELALQRYGCMLVSKYIQARGREVG